MTPKERYIVSRGEKTISKLAKEGGVGVGDIITKITKFFKINPCAKCENRRQILNQLRIRNWFIEWQDIKDL